MRPSLLEPGLGYGVTASIHRRSRLQMSGAEFVHIWNLSRLTFYSPSAPSNPNVTRAAQCTLNDTYLAAVSLVNGDRQLFFQDSTSLIRRAIRTAPTNQWSTSVNQNVSLNSNPKSHTPLAVAFYNPLPVTESDTGVLFKIQKCIILVYADLYID